MYSAPIEVLLDVTNACNLACIHCNRVPGTSPGRDELTISELRALMDQLARLEVPILSIVGGEPLIRTDLVSILEYAHEKGFVTTVGTNAVLMAPDIAQDLSRLTKSVIVSLDSAVPEIHDGIRGVDGASQAAINGIDMLLEAGCRVVVETTLTKINYEHFLEIFDFGIELGVSEFLVHDCVSAGRAASNFQRVILEGSAVTQMLKEVRRKGECIQDKMDIKVLMPAYETPTNDPLSRVCKAGELVCGIGATGDVFPCWSFNSYPEMSAGNIREQDFEDIWLNSTVLNRFRGVQATMLAGRCKGCDRKEVCLGGCRAAAYAIYGDILAGDPRCPYSSSVAPSA